MHVISICTNIARISTISKLTLYKKDMSSQLANIWESNIKNMNKREKQCYLDCVRRVKT